MEAHRASEPCFLIEVGTISAVLRECQAPAGPLWIRVPGPLWHCRSLALAKYSSNWLPRIDLMRFMSLTLCGFLTISALAFGQDPGQRRYFPLNTPLPPPGRAGNWAGGLGKTVPAKFQQVQIQLPAAGTITWYDGGPARGISLPAPSMAGLLVGPVYRLKLSDMTDLPGVELFPSIELVDRLHPPVGRETQFPVIVPFTDEEIYAAKQGSLVVKVIYLEQPNRAAPVTAERGKAIPAIHVSGKENPLEVADVHGRPLAIVRLGGRVPDTNRPEPGFFGMGAPLQISKVQPLQDEGVAVPKPKAALPIPDAAPETEPAPSVVSPPLKKPAKAPNSKVTPPETPDVKPEEGEPKPEPDANPDEKDQKDQVEKSEETPSAEPETELPESSSGAPQAKPSDFE